MRCLSTSPPNLVEKHHIIGTKMNETGQLMNLEKDENACLSNMISQTETFDDEIELE
jgi:hypothetical protein